MDALPTHMYLLLSRYDNLPLNAVLTDKQDGVQYDPEYQ